MTTTIHESLLPITRRRAWALMLFGPASSWDNPLNGTRYDPILRGRRDLQASIARRDRREHRHDVPPVALDHTCRDE